MNSKGLLKWLNFQRQESDPRYVYEPIPSGEYIRVFELDAGNGQITGQMRLISLGQAFRSYDALSYCWGNPKHTVDIYVSHKRIAVTINLNDALHRLRHGPGSQPRTLWVDAICINQEDREEQGHQVQMMGKIYEYARCVPVWLGIGDERMAKNSFSLVKETARASRELLATFGIPTQIPDSKALPYNPFCQDMGKWKMVDALTSLPWFTRVWVKQEVGLAAQCIIMYGTESMDIADLMETTLISTTRVDLFPSPNLGLYTLLDTFSEIWMSYGNSKSWRNELSPSLVGLISQRPLECSFTSVLHMARRFRATDSRDYVYAFLGHPAARHPKTHVSLINADYSKSLHDVYFDAARALLEYPSTDLTFLLSCVDRDQKALDEDYPSWVPQWHLARFVASFGYLESQWYQAGDYSSDGQFTLLEDKSLKLRGIVFDEISWTSQPIKVSEFGNNSLPAGFRELAATRYFGRHLGKFAMPVKLWHEIRRRNLCSQYGDEFQDALIMTLVAGRNRKEDEIIQHRADFWAYCVKINANIPGTTSDERTRYAEGGEAWRFEKDITWATEGRKFFATKLGYFGLGHKLIRPGDACCIFAGVRVPFITRPTRNATRYKLIGDSYIHGISKKEIYEKKSFHVHDIIIE
jgi:hypothetical protein